MTLKTALYPWQQAAVDKLLGIRVGALYMEMGTGKTRTALELIKRRMDAGKLDKVLWLCPCSVRQNLREDILKHSDDALPRIAIAGIESLSSSQRLYAKLFDYLQRGRSMVIVDESNLVKNCRAIRTQRIEQLAALARYRLILNGTPVSRNEADLYAQWRILDWRILGYQSYWSFAANHLEYDEKYRHKVRRVLHVDYLTDKISPYSYMVKKADVLRLPEKCYEEISFRMTYPQRVHYRQVTDAFLSTLISEDDDAAIYRTFTALQEVTSGRRITSDADKRIQHEPFFSDPQDNPRTAALLCLLDRIPADKTIIWCKFQHEIDSVAAMLEGIYGADAVQLFCGKLSPKQRDKSIVRFRDGARFLVANKACAGYGLNLQFCHQAIYYNNDWDWSTRAQSEDRIHRLGQTDEVRIYDIIAQDSIDMRIHRCLAQKSNLADDFRQQIKRKHAHEWLRGREADGLNDTIGIKQFRKAGTD